MKKIVLLALLVLGFGALIAGMYLVNTQLTAQKNTTQTRADTNDNVQAVTDTNISGYQPPDFKYTGPVDVKRQDGVIGRWDMDQNTFMNVVDSSGFNNHGKNVGAKPAVGMNGSAVRLMPSQFLSLPVSGITKTNGSIILTVNLKFHSLNQFQNTGDEVIMEAGDISVFARDGVLMFTNLATNAEQETSGSVNQDVWTRLVFTYNIAGQTMTISQDGKEVGSLAGISFVDNGSNILIGTDRIDDKRHSMTAAFDDITLENR